MGFYEVFVMFALCSFVLCFYSMFGLSSGKQIKKKGDELKEIQPHIATPAWRAIGSLRKMCLFSN